MLPVARIRTERRFQWIRVSDFRVRRGVEGSRAVCAEVSRKALVLKDCNAWEGVGRIGASAQAVKEHQVAFTARIDAG
jgi:hypothetical protein